MKWPIYIFFIENDQFIFDQIKIQPPYLFSTKIGLVNTQKRPHYNTLFWPYTIQYSKHIIWLVSYISNHTCDSTTQKRLSIINQKRKEKAIHTHTKNQLKNIKQSNKIWHSITFFASLLL
jgi:hypothetical protein